MTAIDFEELQQKLNSYTLIDVRKAEEIVEDGKLPGAFNIPFQEFEEAISLNSEEFYAKFGFLNFENGDQCKVVYCRSGRRVGLAQEILSKKGYDKHRLYFGSFLDWKAKGGDVELLERKKLRKKEIVNIESCVAVTIGKLKYDR